MEQPAAKVPLPHVPMSRRGPPDFSAPRPPRPPPPRRPPGPLILGPRFRPRAEPENPPTIHFRFRTRILNATASPVRALHPNVLRLRLQPSIVQQVLQALVCLLLPSSIQTWLDSSFPEWNLPSQVILKKHKGEEDWDEEFETEKVAYATLQPLQGIVVPRYFGEVCCENTTRALLLSDIGGACLADPHGALLEIEVIRRMLCQALMAMSRLGILQNDTKLDNFHVVGDRVMIADLERLREGFKSDDQIMSDIEYDVKVLANLYEGN